MSRLHSVICSHRSATLEGQLALPEGPGPHAAVMVMHNAMGLGEHMLSVARRLAGEGYVALATDMYGGGICHEDSKAAGSSMLPLVQDPDLLRERVVAWYDLLKTRAEVVSGRVAAIGYCFGGQSVLELARSGADVRLVVSFHGLLTTAKPALPGVVKAKVAVHTGARDPYAPRTHVDAFREEMIAAGADWQIAEYGSAFHAFTDPEAADMPVPGLAYDPLTDAVSWGATLALLRAVLHDNKEIASVHPVPYK